MNLHPQFIADDQGNPCPAVLSIIEFREIERCLEAAAPIAGAAHVDPPSPLQGVHVNGDGHISGDGDAGYSPSAGSAPPPPAPKTEAVAARNGQAHASDPVPVGERLRAEVSAPGQGFVYMPGKVKGYLRRAGAEWILLAGSTVRADPAPSLESDCKGVYRRRSWLVEMGAFVPDATGWKLVVIHDVPCSSPTEAAELVAGCPRSGHDAWTDIETGQRLGDFV